MKIYVRFSVKPKRVTNPNSPIFLNLDRFEFEAIDGLVGILEREKNGDSKRWDKWENEHIGKIRGYYNRGMELSKNLTVDKNII